MALEILQNVDELLSMAAPLPTIQRANREEEPLPEIFDELLPKLKEREKQYVPVISGITKMNEAGERTDEYTRCLTTIQRWNRQLKAEGFRASHRSLNENTVAVYVGYDPELVANIASRTRS